MSDERENNTPKEESERSRAADEHIRAVRDRAERLLEAKQWSPYLMALLQLVDLSPDPDERLTLLHEIASLYTDRFANHPEAIKAYESVRRLDPTDGVAIEYLRTTHERRREWVKLIQLEREVLDVTSCSGAMRAAKHLELARLALSKIPANHTLCTELWNAVLLDDPTNLEAISTVNELMRSLTTSSD